MRSGGWPKMVNPLSSPRHSFLSLCAQQLSVCTQSPLSSTPSWQTGSPGHCQLSSLPRTLSHMLCRYQKIITREQTCFFVNLPPVPKTLSNSKSSTLTLWPSNAIKQMPLQQKIYPPQITCWSGRIPLRNCTFAQSRSEKRYLWRDRRF